MLKNLILCYDINDNYAMLRERINSYRQCYKLSVKPSKKHKQLGHFLL